MIMLLDLYPALAGEIKRRIRLWKIKNVEQVWVRGVNEYSLVQIGFKTYQGHPSRYFPYRLLDRWSWS